MFCRIHQTVHGVFTPGITLQITSVTSVGHSYPYPELLEVLYDLHTCTRNFWNFCFPVATMPGERVQHVLYPLGTSVSSVRLCHNIRNFWEFCKTSRNCWKFCEILTPLPGNSVTPVRLWHNTRGTGIPSLQYPRSSVYCGIDSDLIRKVYYALIFYRMSSCFVSHANRTSNTASSIKKYKSYNKSTCC